MFSSLLKIVILKYNEGPGGELRAKSMKKNGRVRTVERRFQKIILNYFFSESSREKKKGLSTKVFLNVVRNLENVKKNAKSN